MANRLFAHKALQLLGLVALTSLLVIAAGRDPDSAAAVMRDKHARLAKLPSPKVVLVGGSNLTYGLASDRVEAGLHRPVVNMGYTVGVGLRFMLADVEPDLHPGDLVVLVPEYELFQNMVAGNGDALNVILQHPASVRAVESWSQVWSMVRYLPIALQINLKRYLLSPIAHRVTGASFDTERVIPRSNLNEQGDLVSYLDDPPSKQVEFDPLTPDFVDPRSIAVLNDFDQRLRRRGARLALVFPALGQGLFDESLSTIQLVERSVRSQTTIAVPASPERYLFPQAELFDSIYHLRREARRVRTARMIEDLRPLLGPGFE